MSKKKIPLLNILGGSNTETDVDNNKPDYTKKIILKPETDIYKTDTYDTLHDNTQEQLNTFRGKTETFLNEQKEKIESANTIDETKKEDLVKIFDELTKHTIGPDGKQLLKKADGIFQKRIQSIQKSNKSKIEAERLKIKEGINTETNKYLDKTNSIMANVKETINDNKDDINDVKQIYQNAAQRLKKRSKDLNNILKTIKYDQKSIKKISSKVRKALDKKLKANLKSSQKRLNTLRKNSSKEVKRAIKTGNVTETDNLDIVISKTITDINNEIKKLKNFNIKRDELDIELNKIDGDFLTRGLKGLTLDELNGLMDTLKKIHKDFKPGSQFKMPKGETLNTLKLILKKFNSLVKRQKKLKKIDDNLKSKKDKLKTEEKELEGGGDFIKFEDHLIYEPRYLDYIKYKIKYLELKYLGYSKPI